METIQSVPFRILAERDYLRETGRRVLPRGNLLTVSNFAYNHQLAVYDSLIAANGSPQMLPRMYLCSLSRDRLEGVIQTGKEKGQLSASEIQELEACLGNGGGIVQVSHRDFSTSIIDECAGFFGSLVYSPQFKGKKFRERMNNPGLNPRDFVFSPFPIAEDASEPGARRFRKAVLTPSQEKDLFLRYNYGKYMLADLVPKFMAGVRYDAGKINYFADMARESKEIISSANLALVISMAKRFQFPNIDFSDLVSVGNLTLLNCIEKFDISRGFKFSTYACSAILKSFTRLAEKEGRYHRTFAASFDPKLETTDHAELSHLEEHQYIMECMKKSLRDTNSYLTDLEILILQERFLNVDERGKGRTMNQIGVKVNLTKERVRQLQEQALLKMRIAIGKEIRYIPPELRRTEVELQKQGVI